MESTKENKVDNKTKTKKIVFNVIKAIIIILLIPILFFNIVMIADKILHPDEIPSFFGWKPFIVMSGSMETEIYVGDVAITKEVDTNTLKTGDVVAYRYDKETVITHRIIEDSIDEDGQRKFVTKGDNNNSEDLRKVELSQIEGKFIKRIPKLGHVLLFIQSPVGTAISLSIPILILIVMHAIENRKNSKYIINEESKNEDLRKEIEQLKKQNEELQKNKEN